MKIAIVNKLTKKVETSYEDQAPNQGKYGGPWGNPEICEHVEIPQDLESEDLKNLEAYTGEKQIGIYSQQDGEEQAYDSKNKPLKNSQGEPIMVPKYKDVPVIQSARLMRIK